MGVVLDLSTADSSGFEPFKGGLYPMAVTKMEPVEVKNESGEGTYPSGTPGYNCEFTVQEGDFEGRKVFNNYWIPGQDWINTLVEDSSEKGVPTKKKANFTIGRFVRLLVAAGIEEKDIKSGKYKFKPEDVLGKKIMCNVGVQPAKDGYDARNTIRDTRPYQTTQESGIL